MVAPILAVAAYGLGWGRYFTSEDFLLVRFLGERPPWRDPDLWTGPWLGVTVVGFYRPVSTLLYGIEVAAFGGRPLGYNVIHTLVHAASAVLVFAIARRLLLALDPGGAARDRLAAAAVAVLFALFPLHPNAVLFGASFATVFGAAFSLASVLAYQRHRATGGRGALVASLGLFALALASYEASAVVPALLVALDVLAVGRGRVPYRRAALVWLPFFALLAVYFLLRRAIFGAFVGGYAEASDRLRRPRWSLWLADLAVSIEKLHAPAYDHPQTAWAPLVAVALACAAPLVFWGLARHRAGPGSFRLWLFAWAWIVVSMAPFAWRNSVPGNGRYGYVTAVGVAMATTFLARGLAAALGPRWRALPWVGLACFAGYWAWLLAGHLHVYTTAGRTTRTIQGALVRAHAEAGAPPRLFVTRYPYFLTSRTLTPVAQVFHYGLRDSVNPPFVGARVPVAPLPPLDGAALAPVFRADPDAVVLAWDETRGRFSRIDGAPVLATALPDIPVVGPPDGGALGPADLGVELLAAGIRRVRLVVIAPGNAFVGAGAGADERIAGDGRAVTLSLPLAFVTSMARLYPGATFFWWAEAHDDRGRPVAASRMRAFQLRDAGPPGLQ